MNNVGKVRAPCMALVGGGGPGMETARGGRREEWLVKQRSFQRESVDYSFSFVCLKISLLFSITQIVL